MWSPVMTDYIQNEAEEGGDRRATSRLWSLFACARRSWRDPAGGTGRG
jgi:hypothetical protein